MKLFNEEEIVDAIRRLFEYRIMREKEQIKALFLLIIDHLCSQINKYNYKEIIKKLLILFEILNPKRKGFFMGESVSYFRLTQS